MDVASRVSFLTVMAIGITIPMPFRTSCETSKANEGEIKQQQQQQQQQHWKESGFCSVLLVSQCVLVVDCSRLPPSVVAVPSSNMIFSVTVMEWRWFVFLVLFFFVVVFQAWPDIFVVLSFLWFYSNVRPISFRCPGALRAFLLARFPLIVDEIDYGTSATGKKWSTSDFSCFSFLNIYFGHPYRFPPCDCVSKAALRSPSDRIHRSSPFSVKKNVWMIMKNKVPV